MSNPDVLAIVGTTATGKSELAIRLCQEIGGEIINADALQVYRGLDIGTAKPSTEQLCQAPHHLIDILDPSEPYSAGEFARRAAEAIRGVRRRGKVSVLVGGSGLYLRALTVGLVAIPETPPAVRVALRERLEDQGLGALRLELERTDPETHARLNSGDTQRVLRALEIVQATGRPQSWWLRQPPSEPTFDILCFGLTLPRSVLYDLIEARVDAMLLAGWLNEVERLLSSGCTTTDPAFQAIGYRELSQHLAGGMTLDQARTAIITATRRYAKRQETWFKKEGAVRWLEATDPDPLLQLMRVECSSLFSMSLEEGAR